jgi:tRNA A-37 threonylcarbamoyl transferase component Bud32
MKICPECQSEYEDSVEFCARDGMKLRAAMTQNADPLIGKALDNKWVIEEKIGEGGMGAVYKGYQRGVNRKVAVKTLRAALVDSQEFVDRFFREGRVATTISNPHCVTIYDFGQGPDGTLFLAMEYLDGLPLADVLKERRLSAREAIKVGVQISAALAAAHAARIVHRDLKPDNIFLLHMPDQSTFAKVLDFGIAKDTGSAAEKYTRTGQIFGTPAYMSPEQCTGSPLDGRSDLYSLGIILYEIVSQSPPFGGNTTSPMRVLLDHVNTVPPQLDAAALDLTPGFAAIIMRLIEKSPDARFADAQALQRALEAELAQLDGHDMLRSTGQLPSAATVARAPTAQVSAAPPASLRAGAHTASVELVAVPAPAPSRLRFVVAGLIVLIVLAGGAAFAVYKGGQRPADPATDPIAAQQPAAPEVNPPAEPPPAEPPPAEPAPVDPAPAEPMPTDPTPAEPALADPTPVDVVPEDAKPEDVKADKKPRDKKLADKKPADDKKPVDDKKPADGKTPKDKGDAMVDALGI